MKQLVLVRLEPAMGLSMWLTAFYLVNLNKRRTLQAVIIKSPFTKQNKFCMETCYATLYQILYKLYILFTLTIFFIQKCQIPIKLCTFIIQDQRPMVNFHFGKRGNFEYNDNTMLHSFPNTFFLQSETKLYQASLNTSCANFVVE